MESDKSNEQMLSKGDLSYLGVLAPPNFLPLWSSEADYKETPDWRFQQGGITQQFLIKADGDKHKSTCISQSLSEEALRNLSPVCHRIIPIHPLNSRSNGKGSKFAYSKSEVKGDGGVLMNAINLSRDTVEAFFKKFNIPNAFLTHLFRRGDALGSIHDHQDMGGTNSLQIGEDSNAESVLSEKGSKYQKQHHMWCTMPCASLNGHHSTKPWATDTNEGGDIEIYSVFQHSPRRYIMVAFRLPKLFIDDYLGNEAEKQLQRYSDRAQEPFGIHVVLLQAAVRSWEIKQIQEKYGLNENENHLYKGNTFSQVQLREQYNVRLQIARDHASIISLLRCAYRLQRGLKEDQAAILPPRSYSKMSEILQFLIDQTIGLESYWTTLYQRCQTCLETNDHLRNEKTWRDIRDLTEASKKVQEAAKEETEMIGTLTIATFIFLPTSLIFTVFGSNYANYDVQSHSIRIAFDIWKPLLASAVVTVVGLVVWRKRRTVQGILSRPDWKETEHDKISKLG